MASPKNIRVVVYERSVPNNTFVYHEDVTPGELLVEVLKGSVESAVVRRMTDNLNALLSDKPFEVEYAAHRDSLARVLADRMHLFDRKNPSNWIYFRSVNEEGTVKVPVRQLLRKLSDSNLPKRTMVDDKTCKMSVTQFSAESRVYEITLLDVMDQKLREAVDCTTAAAVALDRFKHALVKTWDFGPLETLTNGRFGVKRCHVYVPLSCFVV